MRCGVGWPAPCAWWHLNPSTVPPVAVPLHVAYPPLAGSSVCVLSAQPPVMPRYQHTYTICIVQQLLEVDHWLLGACGVALHCLTVYLRPGQGCLYSRYFTY